MLVIAQASLVDPPAPATGQSPPQSPKPHGSTDILWSRASLLPVTPVLGPHTLVAAAVAAKLCHRQMTASRIEMLGLEPAALPSLHVFTHLQGPGPRQGRLAGNKAAVTPTTVCVSKALRTRPGPEQMLRAVAAVSSRTPPLRHMGPVVLQN